MLSLLNIPQSQVNAKYKMIFFLLFSKHSLSDSSVFSSSSSAKQDNNKVVLNFHHLAFMLLLLLLSHFSHVRLFVTLWTSPPGCSVHGILQAGTLAWAAIPFSRGSSLPRDGTCLSCLLPWQQVLYHWCHLGSPSRLLLYPVCFLGQILPFYPLIHRDSIQIQRDNHFSLALVTSAPRVQGKIK